MTTLLIITTIILIILFFLYEDHRKKIRMPIVILIGMIIVIYLSPSVRCAVNLPISTYSTFSWKVISYQHDMCVFGNSMNDMFGRS